MPAVVPDLDDELSQIKALVRGGALTPGEKRIMGQARAQVLETKDQINTWWPPLPRDRTECGAGSTAAAAQRQPPSGAAARRCLGHTRSSSAEC